MGLRNHHDTSRTPYTIAYTTDKIPLKLKNKKNEKKNTIFQIGFVFIDAREKFFFIALKNECYDRPEASRQSVSLLLEKAKNVNAGEKKKEKKIENVKNRFYQIAGM